MSNQISIKALQEENQSLKNELADVQYMLELREEELNEIKNKPGSLPQLHSKIEEQLYAFEHMQQLIERMQCEAVASGNREKSMEDELVYSMEEEKKSYGIQQQLNSAQLALEDLKNQLKESMSLYEELNLLQRKTAELESMLELLQLDNGFLKEEIQTLKKNTNTIA